FGAKGDGKTDDTPALHHAIQRGDGELVFPRGDYLISKPLYVPLERHGRLSLGGSGGTARLLMKGPGPALHLVGTHKQTALPADVAEGIWDRERMPTVRGLEIVGGHAQADGIRIDGAMQPTLVGLLIRRCRHGIHLTNRDRNVIIADCHVYENSGVGIFLDRVNLHQTNIHGSHVSYCKQGGIRIVGSEIRNLQICSNDIEYNFDTKAPTSADILFDCRNGTVREGTITGNTIQASRSPGGANIRLVGVGKDDPSAVGLFAITGNLIGSQETAIHLQACRGVVVSGNCIYSGYRYSLLAEDCEHLVVSGDSIDHNPEYKGKSTDQVVLRRCRNVNLTGVLLQHTREAADKVEASVEVDHCENINVTGCQVLGARVRGIVVRTSRVVRVADCTIRPREGDESFRAAIDFDDPIGSVMMVNNFLSRGADGKLRIPSKSVVASGNVVV
ncbi:MAG: right-handed parallel beta-helix repeat-containing protein, partial [Planctomycetes bacterium]|nr:right-handed parallel beta-helix repeat-containing protein [Planctomycetota bacterium]